jgi:hypothetical protein
VIAAMLADLLVESIGDISIAPENVAVIKAVAAAPPRVSFRPSSMSR